MMDRLLPTSRAASSAPRRVVIVVFDGVQTLDFAGPAEVFAAASRSRGEDGCYNVVIATAAPRRRVATSSGFSVEARALERIRPGPRDTVLVAGGDEAAVRGAVRDRALGRWLGRARGVVERLGSVCSGAFILAALGMLDGLRVATHWSACDRLALLRPGLEVDREAIYVKNGSVWTSAGVTTGIDMALAMVEEDLGASVADAVAARLVLYARRPGFQTQFSEALVSQRERSDPLGSVLFEARRRLRSLDVPALARLARCSERTLHRRCLEEAGTTPAKLIEKLRVEHARALLITTARPVKSVASAAGFSSEVQLRRALGRTLGLGPREVRLLFARGRGEPAKEATTTRRRRGERPDPQVERSTQRAAARALARPLPRARA
ncbi:MAG: DJ-1/PfpI family protein [Polyangiaceae bacterium]